MDDDRRDRPGEDLEVLVASATAGDTTAWTVLVTRFSPLVWAVVRGHGLRNADAEEVFQTTWLQFAEHLSRIKEPSRVSAWLATTARHEAIRVRRLQARVTLTTDFDRLDRAGPDTPEQAVLDTEDLAEQAQQVRAVWAAFGLLSARCQQLLRLLTATPPVSYTDIGTMMGMAIGSIGPTRARCLQRLRDQLPSGGTSGEVAT